MNPKVKGYLKLVRPANLPTAAADILAGAAIAGFFKPGDMLVHSQDSYVLLLSLVAASVCLYAGGVVLNDVFDAALDKLERPERPIPSRLVLKKEAAIFGVILLILGIGLAFIANGLSGFIAVFLSAAILSYNAFLKKHPLLGPFNMGVCRGLNLLMGIAILGAINNWQYILIPVVYIFAITMISRGEVHGNNKAHLGWAALLYALVIAALLFIGKSNGNQLQFVVFFVLIFGLMIYLPLLRAYRKNTAENIKKAVMAGVLSVILLDASLAVCFTSWWYAALMVLLLPLSMLLSRIFAVT